MHTFQELPLEAKRSLAIWYYEEGDIDFRSELGKGAQPKDWQKDMKFVDKLVQICSKAEEIEGNKYGYEILDLSAIDDLIGGNGDSYSEIWNSEETKVFPIIMDKSRDKEYMIADGWHRLGRYHVQGVKKVPVVWA